MASALDTAQASAAGGLGDLQTDLALPIPGSKEVANFPNQQLLNQTASLLCNGSRSRSVPDQQDDSIDFSGALVDTSGSHFHLEEGPPAPPTSTSAEMDFDSSDILAGGSLMDEIADVSPSDAVVPTPLGDDKGDPASFFGLTDCAVLEHCALHGQAREQDVSPPPVAPTAGAPEMEEIRMQIHSVKTEIAKQKKLLEERARKARVSAAARQKQHPGTHFPPPASLREAFLRHSSSFPAERPYSGTCWSQLEMSTLHRVLNANYPKEKYCPVQQALLASQHIKAKSAIDVGKRMWLMANATKPKPEALDTSKRAKQSATQTVHQSNGATVALPGGVDGTSTGTHEDCVRTLLDRNDKLLADISDNISKMKLTENRGLMEVFVQNTATAKRLMSTMQPEGCFLPQLKNVDIATYVLHDQAKDALPAVLINPNSRGMAATPQIQRRVMQHHQQLIQHQQMLQHQQMRQHQQHQQQLMKKRQQKSVPAFTRHSAAQQQLEKRLRESKASSGDTPGQRMFHLQPPELKREPRLSFSSYQPRPP